MKLVELKLDELAQRAGIPARTVRYYVQRGLLPPPTFRGKDSSYGATHLLRLKVLKVLQAAFYPLEEIKSVLASKDDAALQLLLASPPTAPAALSEPPSLETPAAKRSRSHFPVEERWRRIVLRPGVELLVREGADCDAEVRRVIGIFESTNDEEES